MILPIILYGESAAAVVCIAILHPVITKKT
jgi:hypothetical protein